MRHLNRMPAVLTVAGSDSGGGAGIQADLKTFAAHGTHGLSVITSITAQNPRGVTGVQACTSGIVRGQLAAIKAFEPAAAKTGMLFSAAIIAVVAEFFSSAPQVALVVDPVMIATSGANLLQPAALAALRKKLLPLATIITPNTAEAEALTRLKIREPEDLRTAARALHEQFGCAVLLKGGHLKMHDQAIDLLYENGRELLLEASRARGVATHGTGCTYSAAIAAELALGSTLSKAVTRAKQFITRAIHTSVGVGPFSVLNTAAGNSKVLKIS
jgi:hydroxymethylpyrimidine kinase/phosphomethylpyrimidine kinase